MTRFQEQRKFYLTTISSIKKNLLLFSKYLDKRKIANFGMIRKLANIAKSAKNLMFMSGLKPRKETSREKGKNSWLRNLLQILNRNL